MKEKTMRRPTGRVGNWTFASLALFFAGWILIFTAAAGAQNQGQNAAYDSSGGVTPSPGFIDASMFTGSTTNNICAVLNYVMTPSHGIIPSAGAVIDARGLPGTFSTSMTCTTTNPSPWAGITNPPPTTILLPATGANPIIIPSTWGLPPNTRLIGEGDGIPATGSTPGTTIRAATSFTSGTPMISFGVSSLCTSACTGISVENLTLDGQGQMIDGIDNGFSQDLSYVDHVSMYQILGTGLSVSGSASNSGPYSNITFDTGSYAGGTATVCASINGLTGTRGIHGLS